MQVITTKIRAATNTRSTKVVAQCNTCEIVQSYEHAISPEANHQHAACALIAKLENAFGGWAGHWISGQAVDGTAYWVNATSTPLSQCLLVGKVHQE